MVRLLSVILSGILVFTGVLKCNFLSPVNKGFDLIRYCEANEIKNEDELFYVLEEYCGQEYAQDSDKYDYTEEISFELFIDYDEQYIITTSVYEDCLDRGSKSGHAVQKYYNNIGIKIFEVRVDATFSYNGTSCSTISKTATFTPALLSSWTSSPSASSGKSGSRAYARAYGTAVNGNNTKSYSVYLYCDVSGNLSNS